MLGTSSYDEVMVPAVESITAAISDAMWKRMPGAQHGWEPDAMATELAAFARPGHLILAPASPLPRPRGERFTGVPGMLS